MALGTMDTSLFGLLKAMQEQQTAFVSEAKKLVEESSGSSSDSRAAQPTAPDASAKTNGAEEAKKTDANPPPAPSEDVDMDRDETKDAAKQSDKDKDNGTMQVDQAGKDKGKDGKEKENDSKGSKDDKAKSQFISRNGFNRLLTLVHDTYATPPPSPPSAATQQQPQWFNSTPTAADDEKEGQAKFVAELDQLLHDVRTLRKPFSEIDSWVARKKRTWLLRRLSGTVGLKALGEDVLGKTDFQERLADPEVDAAKLLRGLLEKKKGKDETEAAQTAVSKLKAAGTAQDRGAVQRDLIFPQAGSDKQNGVADVAAVKTLKKGLLDGSIVDLDQGLKDTLRSLGEGGSGSSTSHGDDNDHDKRIRANIEKHRKRLAELKRAKAAHEAQKLKRMKPVDVPYFLQQEEDTPCATCGKKSGSGNNSSGSSLFCIVCFLEVDYCLREMPTVWCSPACMAETYASHFAKDHPCPAGSRCAKDEPDQAGKERYFFCRECVLSFGVSTFYCTSKCATRDFQRHREADHLPKRVLRADHHDDTAELEYSKTDKKVYFPLDISKHVLSVGESFASCQKKHPDWDLSETKVKVPAAAS